MDKAELTRLVGRSREFDIVGKVEKVRQARSVWQDGVAPRDHVPREARHTEEEEGVATVVSLRSRYTGEAVQVSDRGIDAQQSSLVSLVTLGRQLQIECEPVWECMARMPHATRMCEGSDVELIVLWSRDNGNSVQFEDLVHPRALTKRISYRDMFEEKASEDRSSMHSFLSYIIRQVLRECAISSQFKVEYKQSAAAARRAEDVLNRAEAQASNARTRREEAVRTARKDEDVAMQRKADLKKEECKLKAAAEEAQSSSDRADDALEDLDEGRDAVLEAKKRVEEAQRVLDKAKEALELAERKVSPRMPQRALLGGMISPWPAPRECICAPPCSFEASLNRG